MIPRQKEHIEPKKHFLRKNFQKMPLAHSLENGSTTSFSEGYNTFSFTGKEKDSESGYYYFDARYFMPTLSIWNSVDPMVDKYPSLSPYAYCAWNPVKLVDPDGRDGVCKVSNTNKTLTVSANYYVRIGEVLRTNREMGYMYSFKDVAKMQKSINDQLNDAKYIVSEGEYSGYSVVFDLRFIPVASQDYADIENRQRDYFKGVSISNFFQKRPDGPFFRTDNGLPIRGRTDNHKNIIMNYKYDHKRTRIHEIFHTLFFDNDNAPEGIGNYDPGEDYPNQNDINKMINNPNLEKIEVDNL